MRTYTSIYIAAICLLSLPACSEPDLQDDTPFLYDVKEPDAGPTNCNLDGTWQITLSTRDQCSPDEAAAVITLTVHNGETTSDDFETEAPAPTSSCGEAYAHSAEIAANGCTITARSLATWCDFDRPQCSDYQLTLHAREDSTANVTGTYRKCWCGTPGPFGKKVQVAGSAMLQIP